MIRIALFTLWIAFASTAVAFLVGLGAAFFTAKRAFFFKKILLSFSAIPLCIPPLITALGYVSFFGLNGSVNNLLKSIFDLQEPPVKFLYSSVGIILAQGFYNFPLIMSIISRAWENLDPVYENQARILGTDEVKIFFTITLPRLKSTIFSACVSVFLFCYFSFMIVLLFSAPGTSTLEVEIYRAVRNTLDVKSAALLSLIETGTAMLIVFFFAKKSKKEVKSSGEATLFLQEKAKIARVKSNSRTVNVLEGIFALVIFSLAAIFFLLPFLEILRSAFSEIHGKRILFSLVQFKKIFTSTGFWKATFNSFCVAFFMAAFCCVIGFAYSAFVKINKLSKKSLVQALPMMPLAISSVVLGWLFTMIFPRGNQAILIFAEVFIYWPFAYRVIDSGIEKISLAQEEAAMLFCPGGKVDVVLKIYLPSVKKSIYGAFCYAFAISCGDTTLPLLLAIPNFDTLALYTYRLAGSYRYLQASACAVILAFICLSLFFVSQRRDEK